MDPYDMLDCTQLQTAVELLPGISHGWNQVL